ncbi:MAG: two-component system, NarL family, sensor histidine kinase BarA, partial [Candidatus Binatota bacterium]|nr:two-component system, NarL family, sensor histidine kinase BarA [Candidatus Binatota bacterium]
MTVTAHPRPTEAPPAYAGAETPAAKIRRFRFGLRLKFLLFVSIALVAIGLVFGWAFSRQLDLTLRREFQKRGETLVRGLAANSWLDLYSGDKARLVRLVAGALEEPDVIAVAIHDAGKKVDARAERIAGALLPAASVAPKAIEVHSRTIATGPILAFVAPIRLQASAEPGGAAAGAADPFALLEPATGPKPTDVLGSAEVVFGLAGVERQIGEVQRTTTIVTAVIVAMGIVLIVLLSRVFITPIERIAFLARCIAEGDRTCVAEVERTDELGELADAFNTMTATLRSQEDELRRMNVGLEQKVRERTMDLEVKQQSILAANVELERASRLKSEFLANMSHELRTPLNAVNGFSELLLEQKHGELTVRQKRYVDNILSSGRHLLQLINDILDLAKIEAGRVDVRWEVFSLRHVIETAVSVIQPVAQKKGLEVEVRFDPAVDRVEL